MLLYISISALSEEFSRKNDTMILFLEKLFMCVDACNDLYKLDWVVKV